MHDPVEKYTLGRTHGGTSHVWTHPSVVDNSFGGKLVVDGSLMCKHGSQGGQSWMGRSANPRGLPTSGSAQRMVPRRSFSQGQRRILRAELWALWQAVILSGPGASFGSDCATVLKGLERGPKWCTAARRPHGDVWRRLWDCFRNIGDEAHIDAVTKSKAHLSKAERAKLDETGRFWLLATNGRTSWPKKKRVMTPSNPSCATRTRELSKRVRQSSAALAASFFERKRENDGQTWSHRLRHGTRKMSDETCTTDSGASSCLEAQRTTMALRSLWCTQVMGPQRQNWLGQNVWNIRQRLWENTRGHCVTSWLRRAASCGAGAEREQPSSRRSLANRVSGIRGLKIMHEAFVCCRVAGTPRRIAFLDRRNCSRCKRGAGGGKATKGTTVTGLGLPSPGMQ